MSKNKITTEEYIKKAKTIHGDLYNYSTTIYDGIKNKIEIICKTHGKFKCNPTDHTFRKSGCPKCAGCGKYEDPLLYFIKRAEKIHNNKYDYSKFKYKTAKTKSIIICPKHGEFEQHSNNHLSGKGCMLCRNEYIKVVNKIPNEKIIQNLQIIHNNKYTYPEQDKILFGDNKILIICPIHGEFEQNILNHYYKGNGCEKCGNNKLSKGEKTIEEFLMSKDIRHIREHIFEKCINPKTNKRLPFDFYLPDYNLCIEFDGRQHFQENNYYKIGKKELLEIQLRDCIKNNFCQNNKINLLRISYLEFYKIKGILTNAI